MIKLIDTAAKVASIRRNTNVKTGILGLLVTGNRRNIKGVLVGVQISKVKMSPENSKRMIPKQPISVENYVF